MYILFPIPHIPITPYGHPLVHEFSQKFSRLISSGRLTKPAKMCFALCGDEWQHGTRRRNQCKSFSAFPLDKLIVPVALRNEPEAHAPPRIGSGVSADVLGELRAGLSISPVCTFLVESTQFWEGSIAPLCTTFVLVLMPIPALDICG